MLTAEPACRPFRGCPGLACISDAVFPRLFLVFPLPSPGRVHKTSYRDCPLVIGPFSLCDGRKIWAGQDVAVERDSPQKYR